MCGRAGPGFPVTAGAFQTDFKGFDNGSYGWQNCFVAKLEPDGSDLTWASYAGVGPLGRDMAIDSNGDIYLNAPHPNKGIDPPSEWYANAYQDTRKGGSDCGVMKIKSDGSQVLWATFLGGSSDESNEASVRIGSDKSVYLFFNTQSTDIPTTAGAHDRSHNGGPPGSYWDTYAARLSPDGSNLIYGTYLGGSDVEWAVDTHTLAVDPQGNAYLNVWTGSTDFPTTPKAFDSSLGGSGDIAIAKLSPTGALLSSTYLGGSGNDNSDGIYADASGNVFLAGTTDSSDFPITPATAYQKSKSSGNDAVIVKLSADFRELLYSTYIGGGSYDNGRSGFMAQDGTLYVTGSVDGAGWPTRNAYQSAFAGGPGDWGAGDAILAKFVPPHPALRISRVRVSDSSISLNITNLTEGIPYSVQGSPDLTSSDLWTDVHSFTSKSESTLWGEPFGEREKGFYRVRSGQ